ncbi:unnamed protein product [Closterium sp. NIES-53]
MDQQRLVPRRERERLAFYADNTEELKFAETLDTWQIDVNSDLALARPFRATGPADKTHGTTRVLPRGISPHRATMVQHQQQQPPTAPVRNVMGNITMTSGSRRARARSPSPEPARHPIGAFSNNNPFSTRHDFSDDDN